jgi:hypothetical protein
MTGVAKNIVVKLPVDLGLAGGKGLLRSRKIRIDPTLARAGSLRRGMVARQHRANRPSSEPMTSMRSATGIGAGNQHDDGDGAAISAAPHW